MKELEYCRIDKWHDAGFTGKGIKVLVFEVANPSIINYPDYAGKVHDPLGICFSTLAGTHMEDVVDTLLLFAPDVEVYLWRDSLVSAVKFCIDHDIDVFNYSATGAYNTTEFNALEAEAISKGTMFVCSAGNDGAEGLAGMAQKKSWLSVGALRMHPDGSFGPTFYSSYDSRGDDLDVTGFGDLIFNTPRGTKGVSGTSFSSPSVAGMLAIWKQKFYADNGRKPTSTESFKFAITNAQDIEAQGYDLHTGYGVLRMPEIPQFDVIEMWSGSTQAKVNGSLRSLYVAPTLIAGRNMVGLRDVAELTGWSTAWDGTQKKITLTRQRGV